MNNLFLVVILLLHTPDGQEIRINPEQVTSMREKRHGENFVAGSNCLVSLTDGKFVTVAETCANVQAKLKEAIK